MDWFERLTGFPEGNYRETQSRMQVQGARLMMRDGRGYGIGNLQLPSLAELRAQVPPPPRGAKLRVRNISGDVRALHSRPENAGALFQVASQFNVLEMTGPQVRPEDGVTRYEHDRTQGPACAIAAGAATVYRNYFAPVGDQSGQTADRQINTLADLSEALAGELGEVAEDLLPVRNGYALPSGAALSKIADHLQDQTTVARMAGLVRIGLHCDIEVTDGVWPGPLVSQALCSAVPVAYSHALASSWEPLGRLVLNAAYEATLWAGVLNAARGASNSVFLTRLGGGAFGNPERWIDEALERALELASGYDLDVALVSYGAAPQSALVLERRFGRA